MVQSLDSPNNVNQLCIFYTSQQIVRSVASHTSREITVIVFYEQDVFKETFVDLLMTYYADA